MLGTLDTKVCTCCFTEDTQRRINDGDGVFFIEETGEYFDNRLALIKDCLRSGMDKAELREAMDVDDDENPYAGYIFWTTFPKDEECPTCKQ